MKTLRVIVAFLAAAFAMNASAQSAHPVITVSPDLTLSAPNNFATLHGTATDPDGNSANMTYSWSVRAKGPSVLTNKTTPDLTVSGLESGVYFFTFTARDEAGNATSEDVIVTYDLITNLKKKFTNPNGSGNATSSSTFYWEYLPATYAANPNKTYPVIIFLHGCGERAFYDGCGTTNPTAPFDAVASATELNKVLKAGPLFEIAKRGNAIFKDADGVDQEFIILEPQLDGHKLDAWLSKNVEAYIQKMRTLYRFDETRVYLTGLSLGGIGTYNYAQNTNTFTTPTFANTIAAIAPVAGSGTASKACLELLQRKIPVWSFHGNLDTQVSFSADQSLINNLTNCSPQPNPLPKFTIYLNKGHDSYVWDHAYSTSTPPDSNDPLLLYEWFLRQKRVTVANTPPVANAGTDQLATLPVASLTLSGTGSDAEGPVTYSWTKNFWPCSNDNQCYARDCNSIESTGWCLYVQINRY